MHITSWGNCFMHLHQTRTVCYAWYSLIGDITHGLVHPGSMPRTKAHWLLSKKMLTHFPYLLTRTCLLTHCQHSPASLQLPNEDIFGELVCARWPCDLSSQYHQMLWLFLFGLSCHTYLTMKEQDWIFSWENRSKLWLHWWDFLNESIGVSSPNPMVASVRRRRRHASHGGWTSCEMLPNAALSTCQLCHTSALLPYCVWCTCILLLSCFFTYF